MVSTSDGLAGIEAQGDEHVLVADTPDDFPAQCVRLMSEAGLAERLPGNAFELFVRAHTPAAVAAALDPDR